MRRQSHPQRRTYNHGMPIQIEEPVKASLVIANAGFIGESINRLLAGLDQKTTGTVLVSQPNEIGQHFKALKDRITISLQPIRVIIEKESPSGFDDFGQLADIAEMAIANINVSTDVFAQGITFDDTPPEERLHSFGFNMELGCRYQAEDESGNLVPGETAIARFLNAERLKDAGCSDFSGGLEMEFKADNYAWSLGLKLFPGLQDGSLLLATVNRHSENQPLPRTRQAIEEGFRQVWNTTETIVNMLEVPR